MKLNRGNFYLYLARSCMNISDFSKESGIPLNTVKRAAYGRSITPKTTGKIAKALGVDPHEILEEEVAVGEKE